MARKSKLKFGGSGTKVGNLLRKVAPIYKKAVGSASKLFPKVNLVATAVRSLQKPKVATPQVTNRSIVQPVNQPQYPDMGNAVTPTTTRSLPIKNAVPVLNKTKTPTGQVLGTSDMSVPSGGGLSNPWGKLGELSDNPSDPVVQSQVRASYSGGGGNTVAPTTLRAPSITGGAIAVGPTGIQQTPYGTDSGYDYSLTPEERARNEAYRKEQEYYKKQADQQLNQENIMRDTLRQFQGEIDATNAVYADKLKQSQLAGVDRLGMNRAENFNAGAVNSSFGNASKDRVVDYNRAQDGAIMNEKLQMLSQIESSARQLGQQYYEQKKQAKEAGLESYMSSLKNASTYKDEIAGEIATNIFESNLSIDEIAPKQLEKIAKEAGVSVQKIKKMYSDVQKQAEAEAIKAEQAAAKADRESQFNLSEGQARYDKDGNLIASRAKTYAPKEGGGGGGTVLGNYTPGSDLTVDSWANRIQSGQAKISDLTGVKNTDLKNKVMIALDAMSGNKLGPVQENIKQAKMIVDELVNMKGLEGSTGFNRIGAAFGGSAASDFRAKVDRLNALLFLNAVPQMKGMGALTEREGSRLESSSSTLNNYKQSEKAYKDELKRLQANLKISYDNLGGDTRVVAPTTSSVKTIEDYRLEFPQATEEELNALYLEEQG